MNLHHLRIFYTVAQVRSVTAAAGELLLLKQVPIEGFRLTRTMHLVSRAQKYFSPVALRFREFARAYGAEHLDPFPDPPERASRPRGGRSARAPRARTA